MTAVLIERAQDGTLATIRLNRPDKRNALTLAMWRDLEQAFRLLEQARGLRCIVVRGAGGNFAAGADLSEFPALRATADQAEAYGKQMIAALTAIHDCRHPTVAAIEGLCVGGGLEIALMCDLRLARPTAASASRSRRWALRCPIPSSPF